jgi:hypothetical protein
MNRYRVEKNRRSKNSFIKIPSMRNKFTCSGEIRWRVSL